MSLITESFLIKNYSFGVKSGKMNKVIVLISFLIFCSMGLSAQGSLGYGFRAGLSYSKFKGDLEMDDQGNVLEEYNNANGFHIGVAFNYKFTDLVGLRTELLFSQRGTQYSYEGDSYYILGLHETQTLTIPGKRNMTLNVSNAYIDIPVVVYYKIGSLEISGGFGAGLNIGAAAGGKIDFEGVSPTSNKVIDPFRVDLNYNYKGDNARQVEPSFTNVVVDGRTFAVPNRVGSYYWFAEKNKTNFKTLDFFIVGGLSYYLNSGLYFGGKLFYGVTDVDNNDYDVSLYEINGTNYVSREDKNKNITMQFSVGFSF